MASGTSAHSLDAHADPDNTFKILVATDVHLGFKHQDPVMGQDAMNTFAEVLQLAQDRQVDFVLLGGDLFHDNKPPRDVLYDCLQLLKRHCLGDRRPTFVEEEEDTDLPEEAGSGEATAAGNVSIPVFSIHGNHDEPTGPNRLSVMDLLHSTGLVRYFGKTDSVESVVLKPVRLRKGTTRLALYGAGFVRSDKLHRMYRDEKVTLEEPGQGGFDDWFNVFVLHQNHTPRPDSSHVPESSIHGCLDLVIWGHEHESKVRPRRTVGAGGGEYWLSQPGSTVATEFKRSEAAPKHAALLTVRGKRSFSMTPVRLRTARQVYVVDHVPRALAVGPPGGGADPRGHDNDNDNDNDNDMLVEDCRRIVRRLLEEAEASRGPDQPKEPLIRIKIQQHHYRVDCNTFRFGLKFKDKVANPDSLLAFGRAVDTEATGFLFSQNPDSPMLSVLELTRQELREKPLNFRILREADVQKAVKEAVDYQGKPESIIKEAIQKNLKHVQMEVKKRLPSLSSSQPPRGSGRGVPGEGSAGDTTEQAAEEEKEGVDLEMCKAIDSLCELLASEERGLDASEDRSEASSGRQEGCPKVTNDATFNLLPSGDDDEWLLQAEHDSFQAPSTTSG